MVLFIRFRHKADTYLGGTGTFYCTYSMKQLDEYVNKKKWGNYELCLSFKGRFYSINQFELDVRKQTK